LDDANAGTGIDGMPHTRRRRRIRIVLLGAASIALVAASAAGTMGWLMSGTTASIREFDRKAEAAVPAAGATRIVSSEDAIEPTSAITDRSGTMPAALPANAWIPVNNAIQWTTPVAPGQPLSGLSVRNGDADVTLIAHLAARAANGAWTPIASMTVAPGKEAILHPPAGDYSMTLVAAPVGMAFDQIAGLKPSPATVFRMNPVVQPASGTEPVRFSISKGVVKRLPVPGGSRKPAARPAIPIVDRTDSTTRPSDPVMTITPARPQADPAAAEEPVMRDPEPDPPEDGAGDGGAEG